MQEARIKKIPACPIDMKEVIEGLNEGKFEAFHDMILGHVLWDHKKGTHYAIIIGNRKLFEEVTSEATFFFCDGTFRITPRQARVLSIRGSQVVKK